MIDTAAHDQRIDSVRQAARGRWMEILPAITGIPAASLDGRHHPCPKCGGKDRFRMIDPDRGAVLCNQCFNSGNGDGFAAVGWMNGSSFPEVVQAVGSVIGCVLDSATVNAPASPSQTTALGPPELRNSVYRAVLANCPLDLQHSTNLTRRGLNAEIVRRFEYATLRKSGRTALAGKLLREFGPDVMKVPGLHTGTNSRSGEQYLSFSGWAGMLIPVRDVEGRVIALKVRADEDRPGGRYSSVSSKSKGGPSPGAPVHVPLSTPRNAPVYRVTEGELKADIAYHRSGIPTLSMPGVNNQSGVVDVLNELGATTVRLAFDSDSATNPTVAVAANKLADNLRGAGFTIEREVWPVEYKGIDEALVAGVVPDVLTGDEVDRSLADDLAASGVVGPDVATEHDPRPEIVLTTDEHIVNAKALGALAKDPKVFCRGGTLVTVVTDGTARIHELAPALIRELLASNCKFITVVSTGEGVEVKDAHPPGYTVNALHVRGEYPGVRKLAGIVSFPVVRADGSVALEWGYDPETELSVDFRGECIVPDQPTRENALNAVATLLDVVVDFPFERECHKSAWLALVLTVLLRHLIDGPVPMWLVDANVRGSGKSLLVELAALIVLGRDAARMSQPSDDDECRKRITSLVMAAETLVLLDNIDRPLGCASLDAVLTSVTWADRVLGENRTFTGRVTMTFAVTGNNVALQADTARRVSYIRLRSPLENPEERAGFRYPNIREHVRAHRAELLAAAITLVRAYALAGRPKAKVTPWGSFEAWDMTVRHLIVWLGLADPGETRQELTRSADRGASALAQLLEFWGQLDPDGDGVTTAEIVTKLAASCPHGYITGDAVDNFADVRAALAELCPSVGGKPPSTRQLGNRLKHYLARVVGGRYLDSRPGRGGVAVWLVRQSSAGPDSDRPHTRPVDGDSGDSGDSVFHPFHARESNQINAGLQMLEGDEWLNDSPESSESPASWVSAMEDAATSAN